MNRKPIDLGTVRHHDLPGVLALIRIAEALEVIADRLGGPIGGAEDAR